MSSSLRLFTISGIAINIHVTFLILVLFVLTGGIKLLALLIGIFCCVTVHELCHALVARRFGIQVREITLLPIGGIATMTKMPEKPIQEFLISLAGPASNLIIVAVLYIPLKRFLGSDTLFHPLSTATWPLTLAHLYWLNLILAVFNLIPAFPMDGGRILRSLLAARIGYGRATRIAAGLGHLFALVFAYFGILHLNIILIAIAVFIYIAASGEAAQAGIKETLKKISVRDILSHDFFTVTADATIGKVVEIVFHAHQENFPVISDGKLAGFIARQDITGAIHQSGLGTKVADVMRTDFPVARFGDSLEKVHRAMQDHGVTALPVLRGEEVVGVVTLEDIGRVYAMAAHEGAIP